MQWGRQNISAKTDWERIFFHCRRDLHLERTGRDAQSYPFLQPYPAAHRLPTLPHPYLVCQHFHCRPFECATWHVARPWRGRRGPRQATPRGDAMQSPYSVFKAANSWEERALPTVSGGQTAMPDAIRSLFIHATFIACMQTNKPTTRTTMPTRKGVRYISFPCKR